jgi:hypothetical protein
VLDQDPISKANAHYFRGGRQNSTSPSKRERQSSLERMREQKWEEFNNSDFVIQEELKKIRGSAIGGSVCESLNTSAEYARMAGGCSSFASSSSGGESGEYSLSLKVNFETKWGQEIAVVGNI